MVGQWARGNGDAGRRNKVASEMARAIAIFQTCRLLDQSSLLLVRELVRTEFQILRDGEYEGAGSNGPSLDGEAELANSRSVQLAKSLPADG